MNDAIINNLLLKRKRNWEPQCMLVILTHRKLKQEDQHKVKDRLVYIGRLKTKVETKG